MKTSNEFKCKLAITYRKCPDYRAYSPRHKRIEPTDRRAVEAMIEDAKAMAAHPDQPATAEICVTLDGRCIWTNR